MAASAAFLAVFLVAFLSTTSGLWIAFLVHLKCLYVRQRIRFFSLHHRLGASLLYSTDLLFVSYPIRADSYILFVPYVYPLPSSTDARTNLAKLLDIPSPLPALAVVLNDMGDEALLPTTLRLPALLLESEPRSKHPLITSVYLQM